MCGICGIVNWEGPPDTEPVRAMSSTMVHRGPNADGLIIRPPAILAHRRLSIIDLSDGANQPMVDDSGRYSITFNGEIYNYRVLRTKLEGFRIGSARKATPKSFSMPTSHGDLSAYNILTGYFALPCGMTVDKRLFLARDRLGEKPLYYSRLAGGGIVFASELKALRRHPAVSRRINPRAVSQFLSLNYVLGDECILNGVQKLAACSLSSC